MVDTYDYYQQMQNKNIILAYKGNVSRDLLNSILQLVENKLTKLELRSRLKKKIFNILVEILQNIYHHFDEIELDGEDFYSVIFLLCEDNGGYYIITGNHILNSKITPLKERIDQINSMSPEGLKEMYRERLEYGKISAKGGAGLGIIDIVRRSGSKLEYDFKTVTDDYSFFSLKVNVSET